MIYTNPSCQLTDTMGLHCAGYNEAHLTSSSGSIISALGEGWQEMAVELCQFGL
jgi:hypothetical protein